MKYNIAMPKTNFENSFKMQKDGEKLEFISSLLGLVALISLIVIAIFRSRIIESIILGSAVMDEYKFVSPSTTAKALTLPLAYPDGFVLKPPTLPPDWGDKGADGQQKFAAKLSAWIMTNLIIIALLAIVYAIFRKCRYVSSLP